MNKLIKDEDRKKIYDILADAYLELMRKNLIGKVERKVLSKKILDNVEKAQTFEDVRVFIKSLGKIYPFFTTVLAQIKKELDVYQEKLVIHKLENYFTNLSH